MPKGPSSEGGRGVLEQETTERRSRLRDTGEEERNREEEVSPAESLQAKMGGGMMNSKVSNTVTNVNLCVDRVKEGGWVADPGNITRDTAVCDEYDDEVVGYGRHRRIGRIKEDIPPSTHQRQIHQGNNCLRVEPDTADSILASRSKLMTEPDRKKYYR